jgi:hypothetical protein
MWAPTEAGQLALGAGAAHERVDERPESGFPRARELVPRADDGFVEGSLSRGICACVNAST